MKTDRPRWKVLPLPCLAAALALLVAPALVPVSGGWQTGTGWEDGAGELTVESSTTTGGKWTYNFSVPRNSEVRTATMRVRGEPYVMDPGWEYQTLHWPRNPSIDIAGDGSVDWAFNGTVGLQRAFAGNTTEVDLRWEGRGLTKYLNVSLPKSTVNEFSMSISNGQPNKYAYSMSIGDRTVWQRESAGFTYNQTVFIGEMVEFLTTADVNGDGLDDIVGCGPNGTVYVAQNSGGRFGNAAVIDCQVTSAAKSMLMIAAGDLDGNPGVDLAAACGDGNIYYLLNQGGAGLFSGAAVITSGGTLMASVVIADIDMDGSNDIVAGSRDGKFYVFFNEGGARFDTSGGPGSDSFKVVNAGSGRMNDVTVADINEDTLPDLVGANSNRQFYVAPSLGGRDFDNVYPVVTGALRDMKSVDAVDVDKDGDPDLLGANLDGKVYLCYNLGNAQGGKAGVFNTQPGNVVKLTCETGTASLGGSIVQDINGDEWPDIVVHNNNKTGPVFVILNDGTGKYTYENLYTPFFVGSSTYSIAASTLVRPGYVDIVVANQNQMDIWKSNQGPFDQVVGGPAFVQAAQAFIDNSTAVPDLYGNPWVTLRLAIANAHTGQLRFSNLNINYTYDATVDFTSALAAHLNTTADVHDSSPVSVPVVFGIESAGTLRVSELRIENQVRMLAVIDSPAEGSGLYLNRTYELKGHSNYDLDGGTFNYSWTDVLSGRLIGYGGRCPFTPTIKGDATLRLRVRNDLTGQEATAEVNVSVVDAPAARLMVTRTVTPRSVIEGETVRMEVTLSNDGYLNVSDIGFQVFIDRTSGLPVATGHIGRLDIGKSASTNVSWPATSPGRHRIIVRIMQADGPFTAEESPYVGTVEVRRAPPAYPVELIAYGTFIGLGAAAAAAFFVATEIGKFLGLSLLLPLYTKLRPEEVLDGFTRGKILGYIQANPGAHYNLIKQDLDMPNGTLIHHLDTLERNGFIRSARDGLLKRFFPGNGKVPEGKLYLSPIQDSMAKYIGANPGVSQADLSRGLFIEPHIVKYHIKVLRDANMLRVEEDGNRTKLFLR